MAEEYPKTLLEFERWFATEEECLWYLRRLRWPAGFSCPQCGKSRSWTNARGRLVCATCRHQTTVTAGTIFQDTRQPMRLWFRAVWYVTSMKNGVSAIGLQRVLGLGSYETAWTWLHKLRRAMVRPGRELLHGRVEVDEVYVGGLAEGQPGRGALGKSLVVIAAEEVSLATGRIRMECIPEPTSEHLHRFIQQTIEPGSRVHTDGWAPYRGIEKYGYLHEVSPLKNLGKRAASKLLPRVHRVASLLKRWLLGTHQGAARHHQLDYYLDEFTFRFNRRTSASRGKLFYRLIQQAVQTAPTPYTAIAKTKNHKQ